MAQLDSGMFKLDLQSHSIEEALRPALKDAEASLAKHPLETHVPPDLPAVRMDLDRIREVLMSPARECGKVLAGRSSCKGYD